MKAEKVIVSNDGGISWTEKTVDPLYFGDVSKIDFNETSGKMLCLGGNNLYYSNDMGITWQRASLSDVNVKTFRDIGFAAYNYFVVDDGGTIFKSGDFGYTWNLQPFEQDYSI